MENKNKKGDIESKTESPETPKANPETPSTKPVVEGIEYPEVKPHGEAMVKLDRLLVENEARGTIYYLSLGLIAKQARFKLKEANPKKKQSELFQEFVSSLNLSEARSPRTIQRYIQLVEKMSDDGKLTGVLGDALRSANFTDDVKAEVQLITGEMGITDLYVKYHMVEDKRSNKIKIEKTIEEKLMDEVVSLVNTHTKLMKLRGDLVAAGEAIDPSLDEIIGKTCDALITLSKHPVIVAMLKKLDEELKASKESEA